MTQTAKARLTQPLCPAPVYVKRMRSRRSGMTWPRYVSAGALPGANEGEREFITGHVSRPGAAAWESDVRPSVAGRRPH